MRDWHLLDLAALEHGENLLQAVIIGSARFESHNYVFGDRHKNSDLADSMPMNGMQDGTIDAGKKLSKIDFYPSHKRGLPLPRNYRPSLDHQRKSSHEQLAHGSVRAPALRRLHPAHADAERFKHLSVVFEGLL